MKRSFFVFLFVSILIVAGIVVISNKGSADSSFLNNYKADIFYTESCGCCANFIGYARNQGLKVNPLLTEDIEGKKDSLNIPASVRSCHTTVINGYFIEGHVPAEAIEKLLKEKPAIDGIGAPGMPEGAPGMPGARKPYDVVSVKDGNVIGIFYSVR